MDPTALKFKDSAFKILEDIGKAGLHAAFPVDFEYYMIALELVDSKLNTIDYFSFPVLPSSIRKSENHRVMTKQTQNGINVLKNDAFPISDINLKGNFGKVFKFVSVSGRPVSATGIYYSGVKKWEDVSVERIGNISTNFSQFNPQYKTGYGCSKVLQSIIDKSRGHDDGGEFKLFLYNMALGESYVVVPPKKALTWSQDDKSSNMIWNYDLNLQIVAPLEKVYKHYEWTTKSLLTSNVIQNGVNDIANNIKSLYDF